MHEFMCHNDRLLPLDRVRLSPGQAGLLNGWGVFTTLRVYDGVPFAFERHWKRLIRDAHRIQLPVGRDEPSVQRAVEQVIAANRMGTGCIRIYFIFNQVTQWRSEEPVPPVDLIIYSTDLPIREGPARLVPMQHGRHAANPLAGTKVISWLNNVWHAEQAHALGFEDALLLNERDEVAECTASNIFCVRGGAVVTPPEISGCLRGVTREILLEIAPPSGVTIRERALSLEEIYSAEEVFITSTTRNVQPIGSIGQKSFLPAPGEVTQTLARIMSQYVRDFVQRYEPSTPGPGRDGISWRERSR